MPKLSRPLTDRLLQHLKPGQSATDGASKGLIAQRLKDGRIFWRLRLRDEARSTWRSLGEYPETPLVRARELALTTQAAALNGGDVDVALARPKAIVKAKAAAELAEHGEQLGKVMEAYLAHYARQWSDSNQRLVRKRLEKDILPKYGKTPIKDMHNSAESDRLNSAQSDRSVSDESDRSIPAESDRFRPGQVRLTQSA